MSARGREILVPLLAAAALAVGTWLARTLFVADERVEDQRWVRARGDQFVAEMKDEITGAARAITREARQLAPSSVWTQNWFEAAAHAFLGDFPSFANVVVLEQAGEVLWHVERTESDATVLDALTSSAFVADRDSAKGQHLVLLSGPHHETAPGAPLFLVAAIPTELKGGGWILAGFRMNDLVADVRASSTILSDLEIAVRSGTKEIARTQSIPADREVAARAAIEFDAFGAQFSCDVWATSLPKTRRERLLPTIVVALGLGVAALVGLALYSAMRASNLARITALANASLRQSERRFRVLAEQAPVGIFQIDASGRTLLVNARFASFAGMDAARIVGGPWFVALHPEDRERIADAWNAALSTGAPFEAELRFVAGDDVHWLKVNAVSLSDDSGHATGMIGTAVDITQRMRDEQALKALALVDELTGLYNRRGFLLLAEQQLKVARRASRPCVLVFADLDGLKRINDDRGHAAGDLALGEAARLLKATFRESDIVGRIGGDEFAVLAVNATEDDAEKALARLADQIARRNRVDRKSFALGISTGTIAVDPAATSPLPELLAAADAAMYRGREGRRA